MYTDDATFGVSSEWGSGVKVWFTGREQLAQAGGGGKDGCRQQPTSPNAVKVHHIATSLVVTPTADGRARQIHAACDGCWRKSGRHRVAGRLRRRVRQDAEGLEVQESRARVAGLSVGEHGGGAVCSQRASPAATGATSTAPPPAQMRGDGPPPEARGFLIKRTDPALDALIDPNTKAELMADGFGLNEGPVWVRDAQWRLPAVRRTAR